MDNRGMLLTEDLSLQLFSTAELTTLIAELDGLFPDLCPDHMISNEEKCYRAGQVSVVRYLKSKLRN
jgi:hypothetical protein